MANVLEILIQARDQASKEMAGVTKSLDKMKSELKAVGVAMTAVGIAGLKMSADARKLNAELGMTALSLGVTGKEMRNLALATTGVSFPLAEVTATFDLLARAGIRGIDTLQQTALAFDQLSNAIGSTASVVTEQMLMAMKTYGLTAEEIAGQTDKVTYLVRNTTLSMDNFASIIGYVTPELVQMGLTMDDTIALLAIMESKGVSGSVATRAFRSAISEATNSQIPLNEALGVTSEELENYKTKLSEAEGMAKTFADQSNTQYGIMDKLKQKFQEVTLAAGSFLTPLEPILALMTALGPLLLFAASGMLVKTIVTVKATFALIGHTAALIKTTFWTGALTTATWKLAGAMGGLKIAAGGALAILGPILVVIGQLAAIWLNWERMSVGLKIALGVILGPITAVNMIAMALIKNWGDVADFFKKFPDFFKKVWDSVAGGFRTAWNGIVSAFKGAANLIAGIINGLIGGFESFLNFFVTGLNFFINGINRIIGTINTILPGAIELNIIPSLSSVQLGRIPLMDTGGLIRGPGVFAVGPGVTEIAREPSSGEIHIHVGYLLGDDLSLSKFTKMIKERIQRDDRRTAFGPVNQGYYYGRSST